MNNIIYPFRKSNNIPIVIACDNNYVPFTSVLLTSLEKNASINNNYDILLFEKDITDENKDILKKCLKNRNNLSIRFIDISEQIKNFNLRTFSYYSVEIYFRLFAPWILREYSKILYFDCDLVFNEDIAKLYDIDIGDNYLGAVRDVGMLLHKNNPNSGINKNYYTDFLVGVNIENYFNSGVLVMNLKKFREELNIDVIMSLIQSKDWHFPDQDVLNVLCAEKTFILPSNWNAIPENSGDRTLSMLIEFVPKVYVDEYVSTKTNPYIIHYAMREKPWKYSINLDWEMGRYFWHYAFMSPLIVDILKIKAKTCTFAELKKIIDLFNIYAFSYKSEKNDIKYFYKGDLITKYSVRVIKFETAVIDKNYFNIDGWFSIADCEEQVDEVFIGCKSFKIKCEVINKNDDDLFGDEVLGHKYVFKGKIPLSKINAKQDFKLIFRVGTKWITLTSYNFGRFFPVDRIYNQQYFYKNGYMLQVTSKAIIIKPCSRKSAKHQEKLFLRQLEQSKNNNEEIKRALKIRRIYNLAKPILKKQIWIVSDNFLADDNGLAFFEYLAKRRPKNIRYFFAISKNNVRFEELAKKFKRKLLVYGTKRFKMYSLLADVKLSSIVDFYFIRTFRNLEHLGRDIYAKQKFIFLQHGVISNDMSREHNKYMYNAAGFITTAKLEQNELQTKKYFYDKKQVLLTGISRFDKLYNDDKKYITIMPTWRKYLIFKNNKKVSISCEEFKESNYFKFYNNLLNNKKLLETAHKYGYTICFMQHPLFIEYNQCFAKENAEFKILEESHRDAFAHSSLILSDYSSIIFDFLYLKKPIVYTHFDSDEFYAGAHAYDKGFIDHENDGFGECEFTLEDTVNRLCEYMENNCILKETYKQRIEEFFTYIDKNNSRRIYLATLDILDDKITRKDIKYYANKFKQVCKEDGVKAAIKKALKKIIG